jgi:hypothetical protein
MINEIFFLRGKADYKYKLKAIYQRDDEVLVGVFENTVNHKATVVERLTEATKVVVAKQYAQVGVKVSKSGEITVVKDRNQIAGCDFETTLCFGRETHV